MLGLAREDDNIRDPDLGCDPRHRGIGGVRHSRATVPCA